MCAALILSSVPVLNFTLFGTEAKAATYTKQHTKEYYHAPGTQFIAYLATGGDQDGTTAKKIVTDSGYTLIDKNLTSGKTMTAADPLTLIKASPVRLISTILELRTSEQAARLFQSLLTITITGQVMNR